MDEKVDFLGYARVKYKDMPTKEKTHMGFYATPAVCEFLESQKDCTGFSKSWIICHMVAYFMEIKKQQINAESVCATHNSTVQCAECITSASPAYIAQCVKCGCAVPSQHTHGVQHTEHIVPVSSPVYTPQCVKCGCAIPSQPMPDVQCNECISQLSSVQEAQHVAHNSKVNEDNSETVS